MPYENRQSLYRKFMQIRQRPVLAYVTSGRPNAPGSIAQDAIRQFVDQLPDVDDGTNGIDLIINSFGGDGLTSWRLITMLREYLGSEGKLTCFVPFYAFSAATLIAVGCDEIFMHPLASLGPVDPQITVNRKEGPQQFAYEDVAAYTSFLKDEGGITEQEQKAGLLSHLVDQIEPSLIGASKRASMQSIVMAEKLLKLHMTGADAQKAELIAEKLSHNYFSHGHAVSRSEARDLGLRVSESDSEIESILWELFLDFEQLMSMKEAFDPTAIYLSDPGATALLEPPPVVNVPSNLPPQAAQQIWSQAMAQIGTIQGPVVDFELIHATVEGPESTSSFVTRGKIFGARQPDMNYMIGTPKLSARWHRNYD